MEMSDSYDSDESLLSLKIYGIKVTREVRVPKYKFDGTGDP